MGGIPIKRGPMILAVIIIFALLTACGSSEHKGTKPTAGQVADSSTTTGVTAETADSKDIDNITTSDSKSEDSSEPAKTSEDTYQGNAGEQLLQSASIDLNNDGENEQVEAVQVYTNASEPGSTGELEGRLKIKSAGTENQITFWKKDEGQTGLLTGMQLEDLDGDGTNDIFIIIPGNGASFSYSNYFIYSYKKNISYSFTSDTSLTDFIGDFSFKYAGSNKLSIINNKFNFSADIAIEHMDGQEITEEYMKDYEQRTWIEPVSVDISESSKLALITAANGCPEIKLPLPVFGLATVDMIGEIDLFYTIDSSFSPVLKRFEVLDYKGAEKIKVGSCEVK